MTPEHKEYTSKRMKEGICPLCYKKLSKMEDYSLVCLLKPEGGRIHYSIGIDREYYQLGDFYQENDFTWALVNFQNCSTTIKMPDQNKTIATYSEVFLVEQRNKLQNFLNFL